MDGISNTLNSITGKKRTRSLKILTMRPGEKIPIEFNIHGQAIGDHRKDFTTLYGVAVRTPGNCPLQEHVVVVDDNKPWLELNLSVKFKTYKKKIKDNYYYKWNTDEERHPPSIISSADCVWLVQYWSSPEAKLVSDRNTINRSKQIVKHMGGTKPFALYIYEETLARIDGSIPNQVDMFKKTHVRKDGTTTDPKSTESQFDELLEAHDGEYSNLIANDIYAQVMGLERHGRVRCYGLGPTPTSVFGSISRPSRVEYQKMCSEVEDLRKSHDEIKTKYEELKSSQDETIRQTVMEIMKQMMHGQHYHPSNTNECD